MSGAARASGRANGYADDRTRLSGANGAVRPEAPSSRTVTSPQFGMTTPHRRSLSANPRRMTDDKKAPERAFDPQGDRFVSRAQSPEKLQRRGTLPDRRSAEVRRQKSVELRSKDGQRAEPAQEQKSVHEVTLDSRNRSALASRVKKPPMATEILQMLPPPKSLNDMTLEMQEAALIEDLLFVLMGYEGQYIRFGKGFNPKEERDRLSGPTFRILPGLDPSLHDLAKSMLKTATYYCALETFVDVQSRAEFGAVNHALCASIRKVLQDYLVMIAQLETQFLTNEAFTIHVLNIHILPSCHILHQLYGLAHELLKKNALLDDESEEEDDDTAFDYDKIIEKLTDGGEMVPGNMTGKKIFKGGVVLGIVTRRLESMSGDPASRSLLTSLLRDASRPYMVMLNQWLHHGSINDPHAEFMIREQKSIGRERLERDYIDEYWERRYTIRDHDVPPQLEAVRDKVLLAGKYLNVVRECGGVDVSQVVADLPVSFDDTRFLENVNSAYAHANESLMQLLLTTHALPPRLRSLKHYFFLDPSDFFSYFLELGASELRKPVKSVNTGKLQSLLDLVLRQPGTAVSLDPFKEDVKVEMNEITLINSLQRVVNITGIEQGEALQPLANQPAVEADKNATGFTSLQLDYSVPFPVSLVISRKTVWRYQALFRFLLSLRHLESQLSTTWQTQTRVVSWSHKGSNQDLELWKRRAWTLRARMLVYVQQVLYFCTAEVIEPNWTKFMSRLRTQDGSGSGSGNGSGGGGSSGSEAQGQKTQKAGLTRTVDELMQDHVDFLDTCLKECMLTNSKLLKVNSKLMQTCTIFAAYTNWLSRELEKSEPDLSGTTKPPNMTTDQWRRFQATKAANARAAPDGSGSGSGSGGGAAGTGKQGQAHAGDVSALEDAEARISNLSDIIRKWESNFGRHMKILSDSLNHYAATETVVLLSLCARLSTVNQGTEWAAMGVEDDDA